jgi:hypothetical protein
MQMHFRLKNYTPFSLLAGLLLATSMLRAQVVLPEPATDSTEWALQYMKSSGKNGSE